MSPSELKDTYFFGIPLVDKQGHTISDEVLKTYIRAAQEEFEKFLDMKFQRQIIEETVDYIRDDWRQWGYIRTTFFVNSIYELTGLINNVEQMNIPPEWLSIRRDTAEQFYRHIHIVPITATAIQHTLIYNQVVPLQLMGNTSIPQYWTCTYCTGGIVPNDLWNMVGKMAAINVFHIMGDLIFSKAGIANESLSIDGLSQTTSSTASATASGFSARILGYLKDLKEGIPKVKNYYKGITSLAL